MLLSNHPASLLRYFLLIFSFSFSFSSVITLIDSSGELILADVRFLFKPRCECGELQEFLWIRYNFHQTALTRVVVYDTNRNGV